jgi:thymidylate synthase (FAD)
MTLVSDIDFARGDYLPYLDKGFVGLRDIMGDDSSIVEAARTSYGSGTKTVNEDRALIRYLMRHQHTSVFEQVEFKFHLKMPIFVMRQHIRHRMANVNEYSGRYSVMTDEFYIPDLDRLQAQSVTNKQGSGKTLSDTERASILKIIQDVSDHCYEQYLTLLNDPQSAAHDAHTRDGLSRELARIILPLNNYTELYWKIDLKNLFHFIKLRADPHAQPEIQDLALAMGHFVKAHCPWAWEAFEDYSQHAIMLSRLEQNLLTDIMQFSNTSGLSFAASYDLMYQTVGDKKAMYTKYGMSKRELTEFETQWGLS